MAKYEKHLTGNFDELLELVTDGVLNGSMSASLRERLGLDKRHGPLRGACSSVTATWAATASA